MRFLLWHWGSHSKEWRESTPLVCRRTTSASTTADAYLPFLKSHSCPCPAPVLMFLLWLALKCHCQSEHFKWPVHKTVKVSSHLPKLHVLLGPPSNSLFFILAISLYTISFTWRLEQLFNDPRQLCIA